MKRSELTKIIQEEIDSVLEEQGKFNYQPLAKQVARDAKPADPEQAIQKMADALGVRVVVQMQDTVNNVTFAQRSTVDEKTFERMIRFLEKIGYNVDMGRSDRYYESEPGERDFYPVIIFK